VYALGILVFRRRHAYHAAALAITPKIGREHAQHAYGIEPVRLGPSGAAIDEDAGRLEHIVGDTMRRQQTVQPEPITSCLKTAHNTNRGVEPASNTGAQRRDESEQGGRITALDPMQMWLLGPREAGGDEPG
jgi:hypothetical protein